MKTMNAHKKLGSLLSKAGTNLSLILALLVMSVLFAIMSPHFLTLRNLVNIATYTSINAIMAFGITVAMILAAMDLSQYTVAAVSGMVMALMLRAGLPTGVAIVCALLTGVLLGLLNGVLVSICGVNPIIATLGTQQIYRGFAYLVSNGKNILISNDFLTFIGRGDILGVPVVVLLMIVMFAITAYVLKYTSFGRKIYAIGGNKNASYLSGINIRRVQMGGFVYCSVAGALGGILLASQVGVAAAHLRHRQRHGRHRLRRSGRRQPLRRLRQGLRHAAGRADPPDDQQRHDASERPVLLADGHQGHRPHSRCADRRHAQQEALRGGKEPQ